MLSMFKGPSGKVSFSRVMGFILTVSYLIGFFYILFTERKMADIPPMLAGLIMAVYGINKVGNALGNKHQGVDK